MKNEIIYKLVPIAEGIKQNKDDNIYIIEHMIGLENVIETASVEINGKIYKVFAKIHK